MNFSVIRDWFDFGRRENTFWSFSHKGLLTSLFLLFALLVGFKVHGYSVGMWFNYLGEPNQSLIEGKPQAIRSDDWAVVLPLGFMETTPAINYSCEITSIGHGMTAALLSRSLCLSGSGRIAAIFKPWTWGYYFGADRGLAWMWWTLNFGLFYSLFFLLYILSERRLLVSALASIGFLYAPFQQFWALNQAEIYLAGFGIISSFLVFLKAKTKKQMLLPAICIFYFGVAFTFPLYPPTQVMVAYFVVGVSLCYWFSHKELTKKFHFYYLIAIAALYLGVLLYVGREFLPTIETMTNTVYPGKRFSVGGGWPIGRIFMGALTPYQTTKDWAQFGNICEAATFVLFGPAVLLVLSKRSPLERRGYRMLIWLSVLVFSFLVYYMTKGVPAWFAKLSGLSFVPSMRAPSGLGMWDLLVWFLAALIVHENQKYFEWRSRYFFWFLPWVAIIIYTAFFLHEAIGASYFKLGILILVSLAVPLLLMKRPLWIPLLFALSSYSLTSFFNPTSFGGYEDVKKSALSSAIEDISAVYKEDSWVVGEEQFVFGNLIRMLGYRSLSGTYYYPQFELWKKFDPSGKSIDVYNRYAHVDFDFNGKLEPEFILRQADSFGIRVDPRNSVFLEEKAKLFLVKNDSAFASSDFQLLKTVGEWKIYRRNINPN